MMMTMIMMRGSGMKMVNRMMIRKEIRSGMKNSEDHQEGDVLHQ